MRSGFQAATLGLTLTVCSPPHVAIHAPEPAPPQPVERVILPTAQPSIAILPPEHPYSTQLELALRRNRNWNDQKARLAAQRPDHTLWTHVFRTGPDPRDGRVLFIDKSTGNLIVDFRTNGDWKREAIWYGPGQELVQEMRLHPDIRTRRRDIERRLEETLYEDVGHNVSRGYHLIPNIPRYGPLVETFIDIYRAFNLPGELAAHIIAESGLNPGARSSVGAVGTCQWMEEALVAMRRTAGYPMESKDQFTMAAHCAAYLHILSEKFDSYVAGMSAFHAGPTNVGRLDVLAAEAEVPGDATDRYLFASTLVKDLRERHGERFRPLFQSFGPESYNYPSVVIGNIENLHAIRDTIPQASVHRHKIERQWSLDALLAHTGMSKEELQTYNPNLARVIRTNGWVHLPYRDPSLGVDETFWKRPMTEALARVFADIERIDTPPERWDRTLEPTLRDLQRRLRETETPVGIIYATVLDFFIKDDLLSRRPHIIATYRESPQRQGLAARGMESFRR